MYQRKRIYFLDNLQRTDIADTKFALEIDEISHYNLIVQFLHYSNNGKIVAKNEVFLDCYEGDRLNGNFRIEIHFEPKQEMNKRYLKVNYDSPYLNKSTCIDISKDKVSMIVKIIYTLLVFCRKHSIEIRKYGFRENLISNFVHLKYKKKDFLANILNIKTYLLQTSHSRVGKDTIFRDYMIIQYEKYHHIYLLKLINDFLGSNLHNKEDMTFKYYLGQDSAWSPSFDDRIVEDYFPYKRVELMQYIMENFNPDEALKTTLLNIEF